MHLPVHTHLQGGKYKIIEKIGQGGFGIAYKAHHLLLDKIICIKEFFYSDLCERKTGSSELTIISSSSDKIQLVNSFKKKFIKEAQRLATFQHLNIVQVTDVFEENNTAYFVMEYLEGGSLQDKLEIGKLTEKQTLEIILPILDALATVHKAKLLHLDIKPMNIMFRKDKTPVLIDFGISKYMVAATGHTTTAPIGLSKGYAPLEQYGGDVDNFSEVTDIYSVCATMYRMVTGIVPPEPLQIIANGITAPSDLQQELSMRFSNAIVKGLSIKSEERPSSVSNLCDLLNEKLGEETIAARQDAIIYNKPNDNATSVPAAEQTTITRNEQSNTVNTTKKRKLSKWVISVLLALFIGFIIFITINYNSYNYPTHYITDDIRMDPNYSERISETGIKDQSLQEMGTVTDIDGNIYKTVKIGNQVWMAENLKVTHYRNGDKIDYIPDDNDWADTEKGAYCFLNNNSQNRIEYGLLYNWYAVADMRQIAPEGWHVATEEEWNELIKPLGKYGGDKLKEKGFTHWEKTIGIIGVEPGFWEKLFTKKKVIGPLVPAQNFATNSTGFTALPGGHRDESGKFGEYDAVWWLRNTSKEWVSTFGVGIGVQLRASRGFTNPPMHYDRKQGLSVRCVKNR